MILAIDTSSKTATVAIVEKKNILGEFSVLSEKTHSKAVLPMIDTLFSCAGRKADEIDYIACVNGPGSFTGLRIGASVAKGLSYALHKKIVPVSSLDMLAYTVLIDGYTICPMIDAKRAYVYTAYYCAEGDKLVRLSEYMTVSVGEVIERGMAYGKPLYCVGSGSEIYADEIIKSKNKIAVPQINMHRAGALGIYAEENIDEAVIVSGADFTPVYMSRSQQTDMVEQDA